MNPWNLTPAETRVMRAYIEGGWTKGIAYDMGVSPKTIEAHTAHVRKKMGVQTMLAAALKFDRWEREGANTVAVVVTGGRAHILPVTAIDFNARPAA